MNQKKVNPKQAYKEIVFENSYPDFPTFYDESKDIIYRNILEVFKGFKGTRRKILELRVKAEIDGFEWNSDFKFHRNDTIVLKRDIMPYFEEIEDYEICGEIINLENELTSKK